LTSEPPSAWAEAIAAMQARTQSDLDLERGPLIRMVYIGYGGRRQDQVYTVIHHTVVDGISWRILMEDLQASYEALRDGRSVRLPPKTTSYQEWVARLQAHAADDETRGELDYWARQVESATVPLPRERDGEN